MNFKKLALIGSLAGLTGCYTVVPDRTIVVGPAIAPPAPIVLTPAPVVIERPYRPLWIVPHFHHRHR